MIATEKAVFEAHPSATHLIYPVVYGPRNLIPWEWSIIKRVADGRKVIPLPDDGAAIHSRGAPQNLAHMLLLAVDQPEAAAGQVFNAGDETQLSLRQWVELLLLQMGAQVELVGVSSAIAPILKAIYIPTANSICEHSILDVSKARTKLGYRDVVSPAQVLVDSIKYYAKHPVPADAKISAYIDQFDYALEDRILESWWRYLDEVGKTIPQFLPDDEHPMPHPKRPNQLVDQKNR
jgi:nucleoside-diphosphate-sugar epimerase